jgi:hypothetical protein
MAAFVSQYQMKSAGNAEFWEKKLFFSIHRLEVLKISSSK